MSKCQIFIFSKNLTRHTQVWVWERECVSGGVLHCLVVQVGDQGIWRWMTEYFSGAALTVILVPTFISESVCVCVATSPGTTSACNMHADNCAFRQQSLHTPLCIHTCLISSMANLFHWHAFEMRFASLGTHYPYGIFIKVCLHWFFAKSWAATNDYIHYEIFCKLFSQLIDRFVYTM